MPSTRGDTFRKVAHDMPVTTVNGSLRAVSSAVEHLVYTERVGGSKPSPPSLILPHATLVPLI